MNRMATASKARWGTVVCLLVLTLTAVGEGRDRSGVLKATELLGTNVHGTDGKKLGSIKDLVINPQDGDIQYAVLEFGGFAGIGEKYFAVPWRGLHLEQDGKHLTLDLHRKDLKDAPGFDKSSWPDFSEQQAVIYEFYEVPPPIHDHTKQSVQTSPVQ